MSAGFWAEHAFTLALRLRRLGPAPFPDHKVNSGLLYEETRQDGDWYAQRFLLEREILRCAREIEKLAAVDLAIEATKPPKRVAKKISPNKVRKSKKRRFAAIIFSTGQAPPNLPVTGVTVAAGYNTKKGKPWSSCSVRSSR